MTSNNHVAKKYTFLDQLRDLWFYCNGYKYNLIILFIVIIVLNLIALVPPYLYGLIIDDLTNKVYTKVLFLVGISFIIQIIYSFFKARISYLINYIGFKIRDNSKLIVYDYLLKQDFEYFEKNELGKTFARVNTSVIAEFTKILFDNLIFTFLSLLFTFIIIFRINWIIGIFALISLIIYLCYASKSTEKKMEYSNKVHIVDEEAYSKVYDFFNNILLVKLLNLEKKLIKIIRKAYDDIIKHEKASLLFEIKLGVTSNLIMITSQMFAFALLIYFVINDVVTLGVALMLMQYFSSVVNGSGSLWSAHFSVISIRSQMYRLSLIFKDKPKIPEPTNPKYPLNWKDIKFNNIFYKYPSKKKYIFEDFNLKINKGEKIAVVGTSGSGKSTVVKLLLRLYVPQKGSIFIDGVNINDISSNDLYNLIKIVPQDDQLLNISILDNLSLVAKNTNITKINSALKCALAYDFVNKLPKKINTFVGPNGVKISGGEKQRLCIARAIVSNPQILVLDEATSNLDVRTENKVYSALSKYLSKSTTLITITHRLTAMHTFDKIIVMDKGKIVGFDTHKKLLLSNKCYSRLYNALGSYN